MEKSKYWGESVGWLIAKMELVLFGTMVFVMGGCPPLALAQEYKVNPNPEFGGSAPISFPARECFTHERYQFFPNGPAYTDFKGTLAVEEELLKKVYIFTGEIPGFKVTKKVTETVLKWVFEGKIEVSPNSLKNQFGHTFVLSPLLVENCHYKTISEVGESEGDVTDEVVIKGIKKMECDTQFGTLVIELPENRKWMFWYHPSWKTYQFDGTVEVDAVNASTVDFGKLTVSLKPKPNEQ